MLALHSSQCRHGATAAAKAHGLKPILRNLGHPHLWVAFFHGFSARSHLAFEINCIGEQNATVHHDLSRR